MKKVSIAPGCVSCGLCESACPDVFVMQGISTIKTEADLEKNEKCIKEAASLCPVDVIKIEE